MGMAYACLSIAHEALYKDRCGHRRCNYVFWFLTSDNDRSSCLRAQPCGLVVVLETVAAAELERHRVP